MKRTAILLDDISDHMPVIVCSDLALNHPKKYEASYLRDAKNFEADLFLEELSKSLHLLGETNLPININEIDIYMDKFIKGGESSSQFQWFTIDKIEL